MIFVQTGLWFSHNSEFRFQNNISMKTSLLFIFTILSSLSVNAQKLEFKVFYDEDLLLVKYKGDVADGKGEAYDAEIKKRKIYEGDWKNNQFEGKGKIWNYSALVYDGDLKSGKPSGFGKWYYREKDGRDYYEGEWKNGKKNGKGKLQNDKGFATADCNYYIGDWVDDEKHGKGKQL